MISSYLSLGSNLGSPERKLRQAKKIIQSNLPASRLKQSSRIYRSQRLGYGVKPNYRNQVLCIKTRLPPLHLLNACQLIEKKFLRSRKIKWSSRTLDVDILLYGKKRIKSLRLTVPHPEMEQRDFVLVPLREITKQLKFESEFKQQYLL